MDVTIDQTNQALEEIHRYQKEALKALLLKNIPLAQEWNLAIDAAAHFLRRKKCYELLGTPCSSLIHQVTTLMLSTRQRQEHFLGNTPKRKSEATRAYDYWMTASLVLSSSNSTQLLIHLEAIKKACSNTFPAAIPFLQKAEHYFQSCSKTNPPLQDSPLASEEQLLWYYWSLIIYDALILAISQKTTPLAEEILLARRNMIHAIKIQHHQRARSWLLIALLKENIFNNVHDLFSKKREHSFEKTMHSLEQQLLHQNPGEAWHRAISWLLVTSDINNNKNHLVATYTSRLAKNWHRVSNLELTRNFFYHLPIFSNFLFHYTTSLAEKREDHYRSLIKIALLQEVIFCIPPQCTPTEIQEEEAARGIIHPALQYTVFYNWIYQTWSFLSKAGINCQLSKKLPDEGIVVTLGHTLPSSFEEKVLSGKIFLIDVVADNKPYAAASLHLIQNKIAAEQTAHALYMPHWPQPYLIPRHPHRKNRFENICFFGHAKNLAPELQSSSWQESLQQKLGITFKIKNPPEWHDYSDVDCILAIRDFTGTPHLDKPGTKLYNAWLAGVPFIGGSDMAYSADGHPGKDYLIAFSLEEAFQHLKRLKEEEAFRWKLVDEGKKSATEFTQQATLEHWKKLVLETIPQLAIQSTR